MHHAPVYMKGKTSESCYVILQSLSVTGIVEVDSHLSTTIPLDNQARLIHSNKHAYAGERILIRAREDRLCRWHSGGAWHAELDAGPHFKPT